MSTGLIKRIIMYRYTPYIITFVGLIFPLIILHTKKMEIDVIIINYKEKRKFFLFLFNCRDCKKE